MRLLLATAVVAGTLSLATATTAVARADQDVIVTVADLQDIRPSGDAQIASELTMAISFWRERGVTACPAGVRAWIADFPGFQLAGAANCNIYLDGLGIGSRRAAAARGIYDMAAEDATECALVHHETGHAMGLSHTAAGVMAPTAEVPFDCEQWANRRERAGEARAHLRAGPRHRHSANVVSVPAGTLPDADRPD